MTIITGNHSCGPGSRKFSYSTAESSSLALVVLSIRVLALLVTSCNQQDWSLHHSLLPAILLMHEKLEKCWMFWNQAMARELLSNVKKHRKWPRMFNVFSISETCFLMTPLLLWSFTLLDMTHFLHSFCNERLAFPFCLAVLDHGSSPYKAESSIFGLITGTIESKPIF